MAKKDPVFLNSAVVRPLPENCPDWVIAKIGINVETMLEEIDALTKEGHISNGWLNIEIKRAKNGKQYIDVNTWKPKAKATRKAK